MLKLGVVTALLCAATSTAFADDPKFQYGKAEEVAKVKGTEYEASAEAGVVFTTGNSETTTITAGAKASRKTGKNKLSAEGSITYARSGIRVIDDLNGNGMIDNTDEITTETSTTAESLAIKVRYDRFLTEFNSLFVAALVSRDLPAGKESVIGAQAGYSRRLYKSEKSEAVGEFGYDFSREDLVGGEAVDIHSARAFIGFKAEMTEGATFDASGEVLTNLNHEDLPTRTNGADLGEDTRVNLKMAVSAKINKRMAVQTSIEAKYDNRPAPAGIKGLAMGFVPEASKLDTIMKASFIYTFF
jgi:putative salt-induced outer membrane protein